MEITTNIKHLYRGHYIIVKPNGLYYKWIVLDLEDKVLTRSLGNFDSIEATYEAAKLQIDHIQKKTG